MKLVLIAGLLAAGYVYALNHGTELTLGQLTQLQTNYTQAADQSQAIATHR